MTTFNIRTPFEAQQVVKLLLLGAGIHVDFHANLHFCDLRGVPGHHILLLKLQYGA